MDVVLHGRFAELQSTSILIYTHRQGLVRSLSLAGKASKGPRSGEQSSSVAVSSYVQTSNDGGTCNGNQGHYLP